MSYGVSISRVETSRSRPVVTTWTITPAEALGRRYDVITLSEAPEAPTPTPEGGVDAPA